MKRRKSDSELFSEIEPLVNGLGLSVVELNSHYAKGSLRIMLVVYGADGVSLDLCTAVYKAVMPRLELLKPERDVYLEVCSPGIGRKLKTVEELSVFKGLKVKILTYSSEEWIEGEIGEAGDESFSLLGLDGAEERAVRFNDIQKAKLY